MAIFRLVKKSGRSREGVDEKRLDVGRFFSTDLPSLIFSFPPTLPKRLIFFISPPLSIP